MMRDHKHNKEAWLAICFRLVCSLLICLYLNQYIARTRRAPVNIRALTLASVKGQREFRRRSSHTRFLFLISPCEGG